MKNSLSLLCVLVAAVVLASCASSGNNFDESKLSQIKKGETTEQDLVSLFGNPQNRSVNMDGQITMTWMYMEAQVKGESFIPIAGAFMGGGRSTMKTLSVILTDGKVTNYQYSGGGNESRNTAQAPK